MEHRRPWDGQSVCWHSGEQYLVEWHPAQAWALGESQIVHEEVGSGNKKLDAMDRGLG